MHTFLFFLPDQHGKASPTSLDLDLTRMDFWVIWRRKKVRYYGSPDESRHNLSFPIKLTFHCVIVSDVSQASQASALCRPALTGLLLVFQRTALHTVGSAADFLNYKFQASIFLPYSY